MATCGELRVPIRIFDPGARRLRLALAFLLAFGLALTGQAGAAEATTIDNLIAKLGLREAELGFIVVDPATGQSLAQRNADKLFLPASVSKLATVYAALQILGPSYRFATQLLRQGGDLYLQGGGDPVLTANDLQGMAIELKASNAGPIVKFFYDDGLMPALPEINADQPVAAEYNCGIGALDLDFNRIEILWSRPVAGGPLAFQARSIADGLEVPTGWIGFEPAREDLPPEMPFLYAGDGKADRWRYARSLPDSGTSFLPVKGTSLQTALVFAQLVLGEGISLPQPAPGHVPAGTVLVGRSESPPLAEIVPGLMRYSNNSTAELIGLAASRALTGRALPPQQSSLALTTWLEARLPRTDWRGFALEYHSGLSPRSRVSPRQMAAILGLVAGDAQLMQSLPPLDKDGEPAVPGDTPPLRNVQGKSGTMDYASALAGFFPARDGRELAFAVFVFDPARRAAFDANRDVRVLAPTPEALDWTRRARKLEAELLGGWLDAF
ncbi:MAG TPA: D-alanyl-D-alanine carboxypeptidase [Candidatus Udaeobacter sp.]|nr:D-alanyl-D-alanine carboxypeptidase [Candidatus Udaeobacter sp.]